MEVKASSSQNRLSGYIKKVLNSKILATLIIYNILLVCAGAIVFLSLSDDHQGIIINKSINIIKNSWQKTYIRPLPNLRPSHRETDNVTPEHIEIIVKDKDFQKLEQKRYEALKIGILLTTSEDNVPAKIRYQNTIYDAKVRLKGDWTDQLEGKKWSFRIELKGENTILGMNKFSVHHPNTRTFIYEWLFHKGLKSVDLIGLRYQFVNVSLKIRAKNAKDKTRNLGIYALEESFDKRLIENNKRREGVIIKFDEEVLWSDRAAISNHGKYKEDQLDHLLQSPEGTYIDTFSPKTVLSSPDLSKQFQVARNLLAEYRDGNISISKVFDIEMLAKFNAICNLLGAQHALIWHNMRFYYNPILSTLEPIGFDGFPVEEFPINRIEFFFKSHEDLEYAKYFANALEWVSNNQFIEDFLKKVDYELKYNLKILQAEFKEANFDKNVLLNNQRVIRKAIYPTKAFHAYLNAWNKKQISVELYSLSEFPIEILNIIHENNHLISQPQTTIYILEPRKTQAVSFELPNHFDRLFVNKKKAKTGFDFAQDIGKIKITYRVYGTSPKRYEQIIPWKKSDADFIQNDIIRRTPNVTDFDFLYIDHQNKTITFESGHRTLDKDLIIPQGYQVIATEGLQLDLTKSASIISYSPLKFNGTHKNPIKIYSSDKSGQGMVVLNANEESILRRVQFQALSSPERSNWNLTGAVTFYKAPVRIENSLFEKNRSEDALNIIRTNFSITNTVFENIDRDAFDGDLVEGEVTGSRFNIMGNDAIDLSGSKVKITDVTVKQAGDKAISAGEDTQLFIDGSTVEECEIAIASKDSSRIQSRYIKIKDTKLGFTAYKKKPEFGHAVIDARYPELVNIETPYLIEHQSILTINGKLMPTQDGVMEKMYGVVYGKSSD